MLAKDLAKRRNRWYDECWTDVSRIASISTVNSFMVVRNQACARKSELLTFFNHDQLNRNSNFLLLPKPLFYEHSASNRGLFSY
jgi:hypothetical protein